MDDGRDDKAAHFSKGKTSVLGSSGSHVKYHRSAGLKERNLFPTVLEAVGPRSECQRGLLPVAALFLAFRCLLPHVVES